MAQKRGSMAQRNMNCGREAQSISGGQKCLHLTLKTGVASRKSVARGGRGEAVGTAWRGIHAREWECVEQGFEEVLVAPEWSLMF